jgi:hypothetical protein
LAILRDPWLIDHLAKRIQSGRWFSVAENKALIYLDLPSAIDVFESGVRRPGIMSNPTIEGWNLCQQLNFPVYDIRSRIPCWHVRVAKFLDEGGPLSHLGIGWAEALGSIELVEAYARACKRGGRGRLF